MTLLLVILATNKVFSPQYVLWLLAVVAAAAILDPRTWKPHITTVLVICGLTQIVFPLFYGDVLTDAYTGLIAMTIRDGVLLYLLFVVARELFREVRGTFGEKTVQLDRASATAVAAETVGADTAIDDLGDDIDPRLSSDA